MFRNGSSSMISGMDDMDVEELLPGGGGGGVGRRRHDGTKVEGEVRPD